MSAESHRDPRTALVREKYFSIRPKPLERWLWEQGIPPAAERVFWLHWQEGQQRGDWCSEIPLRKVAAECRLDISTVTRAYQVLQKLGCIRRTDPGRDPANPFGQATAITEVRVPRELLVELKRHPNRRAAGVNSAAPGVSVPTPVPNTSGEKAAEQRDPFAGMTPRDRVKALRALTAALSARENQAYQDALRWHRCGMAFDADSRLSSAEQGCLLQLLAASAVTGRAPATLPATSAASTPARSRKLSVFELARLKHTVQGATSSSAAPEVTRQILWAIEEGALQRFTPLHALHIALKKLREGAWTRPHRMPPNWTRVLSAPAHPETCRLA